MSYAATMAVLQFLQATLYAQSAHALDEAPEAEASAAADAWGRGGYAVLFSLNGTLSLAVQTAVQMVAASSRMATRGQFWMLAGYSVVVLAITAAGGAAVRRRTGAWRLTHSGERGGAAGRGGGAYSVLGEDTAGDIPMKIAGRFDGDDHDGDWRIGAAAASRSGSGVGASVRDERL